MIELEDQVGLIARRARLRTSRRMDATDHVPSDPPPRPLGLAENPESARSSFRSLLVQYELPRLRSLIERLGHPMPYSRGSVIVDSVLDRLESSELRSRLQSELPRESRVALTFATLTEQVVWPLEGLLHALRALGVDSNQALEPLLELGFIAVSTAALSQLGLSPGSERTSWPSTDPNFSGPTPARPTLIVHPAVLADAVWEHPATPLPTPRREPRMIREADGLECLLRLAALWQRLAANPVRRTQQGTLYKRDRDRLEEDPALSGPITDMVEPIPDLAMFWLTLGRAVGLIEELPEDDRLLATPAEFWTDNAVHLPTLLTQRWLGLRSHHEQHGYQDESATTLLGAPFLRPVLLLWLAAADADDWFALEDLSDSLSQRAEDWSRVVLNELRQGEPQAPNRGRPPKARPGAKTATMSTDRVELLRAILLGPAYQLGLIRVAESATQGTTLVQLSAFGRFLSRQGPPPPPRAAFDKFLYIQPNFEIIAYRQGLNPFLVGQLCRSLLFSRISAAVEMRVSAQSIYLGLETGLSAERILERLERHTAHVFPPPVRNAVLEWSGKRERLTYHASGTLLEFASAEALEVALDVWLSEGRTPPIRINPLVLLVEDDSSIPYHRLRMTGSRDYRRPPEKCVVVEADGVHLTLELGQTDLLIDAELSRFADEVRTTETNASLSMARRQFRVAPSSLARALDDGLSRTALERWFLQRAGVAIPPAIRLILDAREQRAGKVEIGSVLLLKTDRAELLEGLIQHPDTSPLFIERLGPCSALVRQDSIAKLRRAIDAWGLTTVELQSGAQSDPSTPRSDPRTGKSDRPN